MLSRPGERSGHEIGGEVDAAGDAIGAWAEEFAACCVAGPVIAGGDFVEEPAGLKVSGEDMVGGHEVIVITVAECAKEGVLVRAGGEAGEVFGDLQSTDGGCDGLEFTTDFERSIGLHIEGIVVADCAGAEDKNQRFGSGGRCVRPGCSGFGGVWLELGESAAECGGAADLEEVSAGVAEK
ncbi:MAG: hypothetical protein RL215_3095 [Planctomycetota bacterium]